MKKFGRNDCQSSSRMLVTVTSSGADPINSPMLSPTDMPNRSANSCSSDTTACSESGAHHSPSNTTLPGGTVSDQVKLASR